MASDYNFWFQFFRGAGIISPYDSAYATAFNENRIRSDMLMELDKLILREMGVLAVGDSLAIIRHAALVNEKLKLSRIGASQEQQDNMIGVTDSAIESEDETEDVKIEDVEPKIVRSELKLDICPRDQGWQHHTDSRERESHRQAYFSKPAAHDTNRPSLRSAVVAVSTRKSPNRNYVSRQFQYIPNSVAVSSELGKNVERSSRWDNPFSHRDRSSQSWYRSSWSPPSSSKRKIKEPSPDRVKRVFLFDPPTPSSSQPRKFSEDNWHWRQAPIPKPLESADTPIEDCNVGYKMLARMGWNEGKSLGNSSHGIREPVKVEVRQNRMGLGAENTLDDRRSKKFVAFVSSGIVHSGS